MFTTVQIILVVHVAMHYKWRMLFQHTSYRSFLKAVYAEKIEANPKYSLRSFADKLGVSHATLSQVLRGNRNLSRETAVEMGRKLNLASEELEYLCQLVEFESARNLEMKSLAMERINKLRPRSTETTHLTIDYFKVISTWHHYALLQLIRIPSLCLNGETIAALLNIPKVEAELALERLLRLEMIEETSPEKYARTQMRVQAKIEEHESSLKRFHIQYLEKAVKAINDQHPKDRYTGSETFAVSKKAMVQIREASDQYLSKVAEIAFQDTDPTDVYHCQLNIFQISQTKPNSSSGEKS